MLALKPSQLTPKGVNTAFTKIKNWHSDLLCKPFYSGNLPGHLPNNWDLTSTGKNGKMVQAEPCFAIAASSRPPTGSPGRAEAPPQHGGVVPEARVATIGSEVAS